MYGLHVKMIFKSGHNQNRADHHSVCVYAVQEAEWASIYFPPTGAVSHPLKKLTDKVHTEHLEVLGVPTTGTMQQLADAVCAALANPSAPAQAPASSSSLPACAFFLEDDEPDIDPSTTPPSSNTSGL